MIICHLLWATPGSCSNSIYVVKANAFDAMQGERADNFFVVMAELVG